MQRWGNLIIGACCALFVAVVLVPTQVYDKGWNILSGPNAAAWAQAVGSFVAVAAAIFIANSDSRKRKRQDADARAAALAAISEVTENAATALRAAERFIHQPNFGNSGFAHFTPAAMAVEGAEAALDAIPFFQIPNGANLISDLFTLRAMLIDTHAILINEPRLATDQAKVSTYASVATEIATNIKAKI